MSAGGEAVNIFGICNRGVTDLKTLYHVSMKQYAPHECPVCKEGCPINTRLGKGKQFLLERGY